MSSLRILMYCNNSRGLGHTARTLQIAASLSNAIEECSILVLTDFPFVGRFRMAERVDYVHLPVLEPQHNSRLRFQSGLNIEYDAKLRMRRKIAQSAIKSFHPDVVMLDESLLNLPQEMQRIVAYIAEEVPKAKIVWEFSDILGTPEWLIAEWTKNGVWDVLENCAEDILIFGAQHLFDFAAHYRMPVNIARKLVYTGYLARHINPSLRTKEKFAKLNRNLPLVLLCPGDDYNNLFLIDNYLRFLEKSAADLAVQSIIITSPTLSSQAKQTFARRVRKLPNVEFRRLGKNTLQYVRFARLVIGDGEYNLIGELLLHRKQAFIVSSAKERPDNFCRARFFQKFGLVTIVPPEEYQPQSLREMMAKELFSGPRLIQKSRYKEIPFDGLTRITERIRQLTGLASEDQALVFRAAS